MGHHDNGQHPTVLMPPLPLTVTVAIDIAGFRGGVATSLFTPARHPYFNVSIDNFLICGGVLTLTLTPNPLEP